MPSTALLEIPPEEQVQRRAILRRARYGSLLAFHVLLLSKPVAIHTGASTEHAVPLQVHIDGSVVVPANGARQSQASARVHALAEAIDGV